MTIITVPRALLEQALEAMEYATPTGKITLTDWYKSITALRAALAEPAQEPVAYSVGRTLHWHDGKGVSDAQLFAAPPQRKPLTEEEIQAAWDSVDMRHPRGNETRIAFARAIEREHGITP